MSFKVSIINTLYLSSTYIVILSCLARDMPPNFHMKMIEEKIPQSYLELEHVINRIVDKDTKLEHTVYKRDQFW